MLGPDFTSQYISRRFFWLLLLLPFFVEAQSSFNFSGQLIQRAEFRNGYGRLLSQDEEPAFSVGQRARLNAEYLYEGMHFHVSAQDVRLWGSAPHSKLTDSFLSVYEAYLEARLADDWQVKLGRQELNYDNARFLGNLDWALQGRSHDAALIKYVKANFHLHLGAAYNQSTLGLTGAPFTVPGHYKTAQMLHIKDQRAKFDWSLLVWNQGLEQQIFDGSGVIISRDTRFSQTIGLPVLRLKMDQFTLFGFYYHQLGKDQFNRTIDAFDASTQISWQKPLEEGSYFKTTLGAEYLSGNDNISDNNTQRAFNPFYGTNHAHNGFMDYFFVGGRNNWGLGLVDRFLRLKYQASATKFLSLNVHSFASAGDFVQSNGTTLDKNLGTELDFSTGTIFNDALSLQLGYSQMFATDSFEIIQNATNAKQTQNWIYAMLLFRPGLNKPFVGLMF